MPKVSMIENIMNATPTFENIVSHLTHNGCKILSVHYSGEHRNAVMTLECLSSTIEQTVVYFVEAATLDTTIQLGKSEERRKHWRDRCLSAEKDCRETESDLMEANAEIQELKEKLLQQKQLHILKF